MRVLTNIDKQQALRSALTSFSGALERWASRAQSGLNADDMEKAVKYELGIEGGSGGPERLRIHYQGSGLKIWAAWETINPYEVRPIYQGEATIKAARLLFGVKDPSDDQLSLF